MRPRASHLLWLLIGAGAALRLYVAFKSYGERFDMDSYRIVADAILDGDLFSTYEQIRQGEISRGPYPPGYWPVVVAVRELASGSLPFHGLIQVVPILADAGIALLVWGYLGDRGVSERTRLAGAGLVAVGPAFAYVSGYHGHFDSVAILPAVAALMVWERPAIARRALVAGLLIGLGAAFKTVPILMLLALLPTARSVREGATLVAAAVAVPAAMLAPFALVGGLDGLMPALRYNGVPGIGGLSLVVQPELAEGFIKRTFHVPPSGATNALIDYGGILLAAALAVVTTLLVRRRTAPAQAAVAVWLTVYVFGAAFNFQYAVWGLPFMIMAGYLPWAALFQAVLIPAQYLMSQAPFKPTAYSTAYIALMVLIWTGTLLALLELLRRVVGRPGIRHRPAA